LKEADQRHHQDLHRRELPEPPLLLLASNESRPRQGRHRPGILLLQGPKRSHSRQAESEEELKVVGRHPQPVPVRASVAVPQSEASRPATDDLVRHLVVRVLVRREPEKSVGNKVPLNRQPRRLPVEVKAMREVEEREGKAPLVNPVDSQEVERRLPPSKGRGNRNAERKREREHHRQVGRNKVNNLRL